MRHDFPMVQPHRPVAKGFDIAGGVGDEQNRNSMGAKLMHLTHAALPEVYISHGKRLIHNQNLRIEMNRDSESEPHHHAAGIRLDWLVE